jgi:hypothetical protein
MATRAEKARARQMVAEAKASGRLVQMPCRICGETRSEAHHSDYQKPLDVDWLCSEHHKAEHLRLLGRTKKPVRPPVNPYNPCRCARCCKYRLQIPFVPKEERP